MPLDFKRSEPLTMGVELELMVLDTRAWDLTRGAPDLLRQLERRTPPPGEVKPEITESMIEVNSTVHTRFPALAGELAATRDAIVASADRLNLAVAGGGTHPFHRWTDRRIYPTERFLRVSALYGYLAKQFTVFGQHVHIGVADGDEALRLTHGLARYIPHFIALAASSPFSQGEDTAFESARLHAVSAFPLAGHAPPVLAWADFNRYFDAMAGYGIVSGMKDFYWDIRPKPEYGTVEVRITDTPLTVLEAARIAAYIQALAARILSDPVPPSPERDYLVYGYNRFQACRFGFEAQLADAAAGGHVRLRDDVLRTIDALAPHGDALGSSEALQALAQRAGGGATDAGWLRERLAESGSLADVVRLQAARWKEVPAGGAKGA